jgi:hypothetical protein
MKTTLKSISIIFIVVTAIASCTTKSEKVVQENILPLDTAKIAVDADTLTTETDSVVISQ